MHQDTAERALLRLLSVRMEAILAALKQQQWLPPAPLSLPTQGGGSPYVADLLQLLQVGRPLGMPVCAYACGGGCPCVIDLLQLLQEGGPLGMPVCVWGGGAARVWRTCYSCCRCGAWTGVCAWGRKGYPPLLPPLRCCHPCVAATPMLLPPMCCCLVLPPLGHVCPAGSVTCAAVCYVW